jgi:hypothetical protein
MYKQFQLACDFLTILHFTQDELEKERAVRKNLEQQITAFVEELPHRRETERHVQVSHCTPCHEVNHIGQFLALYTTQ